MKPLFLGMAALCLVSCARAQTSTQKFEEATKRVTFFDVGEFVWNRPDTFWRAKDPVAFKASQTALAQVMELNLSRPDLTTELQNPDARVRTMALAALFAREEPDALPQIVALADDKAPTFPGHSELDPDWLRMSGIGPPPEKQSVGDIAAKMANFYLSRAGFDYGIKGSGREPGFATYWQERKNRASCASWFAVKLARASRGSLPTQPQYLPDIRRVRAQIETLAPAERDWTLLYLQGEEGSDALASDAELIVAAKRRGASSLLQVLQWKIPSDDPDLQPRGLNNWPYKRLAQWILEHAPQVLNPAMADALLACEQSQRDYQKRGISDPFIDAAWVVAAARLQPRRAPVLLRAAWNRFNGEFDGDNRAQIASALVLANSPALDKFVLNWLFAPPPAQYDGTDSSGKQAAFFGGLTGFEGQNRASIARFLRVLTRDPRFETVDFQGLVALARIVNTSLNAPVDVQKLYERAWIGQTATSPDAQQALREVRQQLRDICSHLSL